MNFEPGEVQTIPVVMQPADGSTMAGMELKAVGEDFLGPFEITNIWQTTGPASGRTDWSVTKFIIESGDTWTNKWAMDASAEGSQRGGPGAGGTISTDSVQPGGQGRSGWAANAM
jgi:hypothetical protein